MTLRHLAMCVAVVVCAPALLPVARLEAQDEDADVQPIIDLLREPDAEFRALALEQIRTEYPGEGATRKFAEVLPTLAPDAQAGLLGALAVRGDAAAAPAVRELLAKSDNSDVRIAAITALGRLGKPDDVSALVDLVDAESPAEQQAARRALVLLPGEEVSSAIAGQMRGASADMQVALIEILTTRRARNTIGRILQAALGEDAAVRRAAMISLGQLAETEHIADMAKAVLRAEPGRERDAAERALAQVAHRIGDKDKQATPLLNAMGEMSSSDRMFLLPALGRIGGPEVLKVIEENLADLNPKRHDISLTALCNWPDASVAFRLLELARTEPDPGHRRRALRALIRVAPFKDDRSNQLRLDLMRTAMAMCNEEDDRLLILERAKAILDVQTLRFVLPYVDEPAYAEQACLTVVELAHSDELREPHRKEFHAALDHVMEVSQNPVILDRAQRYKEGKTWVRPK